jgi:peptide/nickel transport system permease protein
MLRTFVTAVLTLLLITFISYLAMNRSSEKVAKSALGRSATPEQLNAYVAQHGLDRSVLVRYLDWLGHFLTGDWGLTLTSQLPVKDQVVPAFVHTTELAVVALAWSLPVAILVGVGMSRRGGRWDAVLLVVLTVVAAMPEFVLGIAVLIVLAVQLGWFPVDSSAVALGFGIDWIRAFVLPALTLGLGVIPYVSRITRASVSDALAAPFTRNAVLRGLPRRQIVWGHATRTASVPLVNAIALNIIYIMGGVIVIENVFAFPGLGRLLVHSIAQGDVNSGLAIITLLGAVFVAVGMVADVAVTYLNPRLREGR